MNKLIIFFLFIGLHSCVEKPKTEEKAKSKIVEKSISELTDFELIQDFDKNKAEFSNDTFELYDFSTDGGDLTVYHDSKFDYLVLDFWLYDETGRLNYTYWTDRDFKFKIVKKLNYEYDKPYYETKFKIDSTTSYMSFSDSEYRLFDISKKEITDSKLIEKTKTELESFFKDVTKGIELIK